MDQVISRRIEAVFRMERARLIAGLTRMVRDVGLAEDLAQEALVLALQDWPKSGVPANPAAWLMATAKRRAIDGFRRNRMMATKHAEIAALSVEADEAAAERQDRALDDEVGDELLSLIFVACHPMLSREARAALTLRLIGGLTVEEIARAFLGTPPAIAQRITRAKRQLAESGLAYDVPRGAERQERLGSVLEVIYLIFNEGYAATAGDDLIRPALANEAQRLGRVLVALAPQEPEVFGLLALMELNAARFAARLGADGAPVGLLEQNRARWDWMLVERGLANLRQAETLGGADGFYTLQAAIAACHGRARRAETTDWQRIAGLYDRLLMVAPGPVIALNRAVAHAMAHGPQTGLELLAPLEDGILRDFAPLSAARGDFLLKLGHPREARVAFERAAGLSKNAAERAFLLKRAATCG